MVTSLTRVSSVVLSTRRLRLMIIILLLLGVCGGTLYSTSTPAVLSFWNTTRSLQPTRCRWSIDAAVNEHVEINVTSVNLAASTVNCDMDHLEIRDQPLVNLPHYEKNVAFWCLSGCFMLGPIATPMATLLTDKPINDVPINHLANHRAQLSLLSLRDS